MLLNPGLVGRTLFAFVRLRPMTPESKSAGPDERKRPRKEVKLRFFTGPEKPEMGVLKNSVHLSTRLSAKFNKGVTEKSAQSKF